MSHHLDSPLAREDVRLDISDFYLFRGEVGTVLVLNVCHSLAGDIPTPGYHAEGMYEFKIDTDGDAVEDLTYRFVFEERGEAGTQRFAVRRIAGAEATDPDTPGELILEGVTDRRVEAGGHTAWAGKAGDPFWIEPTVLGAVGEAFAHGTKVEVGDWTPAVAENRFAGHTVYSIVLEVSDSEFAQYATKGTSINGWALATLATDAGGWRPINRAGLPMIHPLFAQLREDLGNNLNAGSPATDFEVHGSTFAEMIEAVVGAYGDVADPRDYAHHVARRFLPNVLPYVVGSPASFGFDRWNGRSLIDNAPNVMFSLAANAPVTIGLTRDSVISKPRSDFPYVPTVD